MSRVVFGIAYESVAMHRVVADIVRLAPLRVPVLVLGPTGSGKSMVSSALHAASGRRGEFVELDCGAVGGQLLAAELFGAEAGAWTDLRERRIGAVERAHGGTLFLDEVAEIPLADQARFLKVVEEGRVRPLQGRHAKVVDVRVTSATNRELSGCVRQGSFRDDLYARLAGWVIRVPSLGERAEDVVPIALERLARHHPGMTLSAEAVARLEARGWPRNVRELLQVVDVAADLAKPGPIRPEHLECAPPSEGVLAAVSGRGTSLRRIALRLGLPEPAARAAVRAAMQDELTRAGSERAAAKAFGWPWSTWVTRAALLGPSLLRKDGPDRRTEVARIGEALVRHGGNRARAARELGCSPAALLRRMRALGVDVPSNGPGRPRKSAAVAAEPDPSREP